MSYSYFCTCPRGLEAPLAEELAEIAEKSTSLNIHAQAQGGVHCSGTLEDGWLINLHSRIASRVLLRIAQGAYRNEDDIYNLALAQQWENWFDVDCTIRIDVTAVKSPLKSISFTTLKIKDAVVDHFRNRFGKRPSIDTKTPDVHIVAFLNPSHVTLYLDTSGESLFKRGWRTKKGDAPLRENLAAGLLRAAGWKPGMVLFDPMCGSGTILAEAAQILAGIPPGINRRFAFEKFTGFDAKKWETMKQAVKPRPLPAEPTLFGSDISGDMIAMARHNMATANVPVDIPLKQIEAQEVQPPSDTPGIILTNPPYGERIGVRGDRTKEADDMATLFYSALGSTLKQRFPGWKVFLFTADLDVPKMLRLKESRKTPFFNGAIECRLFRFDMISGSNRRKSSQPDSPQETASPE
ncbi:class I SAM-dependent RNA methyltransferase [Oxalobacter vibrioformis]|uniref:Class I SAM-dependent RNA methyltransferase n=1 Tax=Oxalobacter vibrioformis TaxID=933080 RepID=A0A9E9LXC2_9BURK|nr:class I SAM-dependent RNA methyltransferase [Oxalobacter vibrioformis]NLC23558.1 class I SAM-dependent RNA methyltransferase [Oxalobacter sp.]WAW09159.1 class I SAM-dependent RNA methyltransferase [Oxalobacter vibrioformis]